MSDNNRPIQHRPEDGQSSRFDDWYEDDYGSEPSLDRADGYDSEGNYTPVGGYPEERRASAGGRVSAGTRPASGNRSSSGSRPSSGNVMPASGIGGGRIPRDFGRIAVICAAVIVLGLVLQGLMPNGFPLSEIKDKSERPVAARVSEIHGEGPVRLNEIMSSNGGVMVDTKGKTPDWVEVANIGNRPVNLSGYILAKSAKAGNVFVFPDVVLQAGECAVVYADSTLQAEVDGELHAPFRLSSGGDVLMLFNTADVAIDTVNIPALGENIAYVRRDRDLWAASEETTPGLLNTEENYRALSTVVVTAEVQMSQIVASNTQYRPDENGAFYDYVVLQNTSAGTVDISGWYLSDDPSMVRLWKFPGGTVLPSGSTLTVYCSGLNRTDDPAHLHTSFRLSTEGETVTLSNASGQPVDRTTYDLLRSDTAWMRGADNSWSVGTPTN